MVEKHILELIKNKLVNTYDPLTIYIFGSYAWGTPDQSSDIDIVIIVNESKEKKYKRAVKGYSALFDIDYPIDLMVYTKQEFEANAEHHSSLCFKIKKDGYKLYEVA